MSKILKNTTGSAIVINDTGVTVPASPGQYTIPTQDYSTWAASSDAIKPLADGDLLFNDGSNDYDGTGGFELSIALDILKDTQPNSINTSAEGLVDAFDNGDGKIRLAIDVGAAGVQIPGPTGPQGPQGDPGDPAPSDHTLLTNIGTNTHAQIDSHIADATIHYTQASISIPASQISDFDTEVSNNASVTANTAKVTNATHTGEVTGSGALTVDSTAITNKATTTAVSGDFLLFSDTSDSGNLKKVDAADLLGGGGGGGDYSDGGDSKGFNRTLGTNDNFSQSLETNGATRFTVEADGRITATASIPVGSGYHTTLQNTNVDGHGLKIKAGEFLGDIILGLEDSDGTYTIMQVEADQGHVTFGNSYAQTLIDNGVVYGVDNQMDGVTKDFNCQAGAYRIGGDLPDTQVSSTSSTNTSSTSYVLISGMTVTPGAGTYLVFFSASGRGQSANQQLMSALYSNGSKVGHTERDYGFDAADPESEDRRFLLGAQAKITVADGQAIEARYKTDYSTFNIFERSLILLKVKAD